MKTKIFISSSSGFNNFKHDDSIEVLNDRILFSLYEEYTDEVELSSEEFYLRIKNDSSANPKFTYMSFENVQKRILDSINEGAEKIIFILSEYALGERNDIFSFVERENLTNVYLIKTRLFLYPLVYAVKSLNEDFKETGDVEAFKNGLLDFENKFKMYLYIPERDVEPTISKFEFDEDLLNIKRGTLYDGNKDGVVLLKKYKNNYAFDYMLKAFLKETAYFSYVPFILYTNKYSQFITVIEKTLLKRNPNLVIEKSVLPPYIGKAIGDKAIVLGFIMK